MKLICYRDDKSTGFTVEDLGERSSERIGTWKKLKTHGVLLRVVKLVHFLLSFSILGFYLGFVKNFEIQRCAY